MTEQDALAEAKEAYMLADTAMLQVKHGNVDTHRATADFALRFAQTAALIAIAEALTEKKDVSS